MQQYELMEKRLWFRWVTFVLLCGVVACRRTNSESTPRPKAPAAAEVTTTGSSRSVSGSTALSPDRASPIVESALVEPNDKIYVVIAGQATRKEAIESLYRAVGAVQAVPVGYPALEQSVSLLSAGEATVVVGGKYLTEEPANALRNALRESGLVGAEVASVPYRHDRYRPALNDTAGAKFAVVFAGMNSVEVPLFTQPSLDSSGSGRTVSDGAIVKVLGRVEIEKQVWFLTEGGYLPAGRLLLHYNVFPAPSGYNAVLGIELDCFQGRCGWDYWFINRNLSQRHLLAGNAERLTHAFSPDSQWLAFSSPPGRLLRLTRCGQGAVVNCGSGISPSWMSDSRTVIFRRTGIGEYRDEVVAATAPDWNVRTIFDLEGTPFYPEEIAAFPPLVDVNSDTGKLTTAFYRPVHKDDRISIERHLVEFTSEGVITAHSVELLTR